MPVQAKTFEQIVAIAKEVTFLTGVTPTVGIPVTDAGGQPHVAEIYDVGRRGIAAVDFAAYQDAGHGEFKLDGFAYPDQIGYQLLGILGADSVTGGADPYTHAFALASTVPSFTIEDQIQGGSNGGMRFAGCRIASLAFSFAANAGVLAYTSTYSSGIPTKVTATNPSVSVLNPWAGWRGVVTSAGMTTRVISATITMTRALQIVHTAAGQQGPRYINAGPIAVDGDVMLTAEDLSDFSSFLTDLSQSFVLAFSYTSSQIRSITFTMTNANFNAAPVDYQRSGESVEAKLTFKGLYNATDAGPIAVSLVNAKASY